MFLLGSCHEDQKMNYLRDLVIAGRCVLRFKRHWYLGRHVYALMLTEGEFDAIQEKLNEILYEHRRDH